MPRSAKGMCTTPGCAARACKGSKCAAHAYDPDKHVRYEAKRQADPALSQAQALLKSAAWQELRARQLRGCPTCYVCGQQATQVHHIVALVDDVSRGLDPTNLMSVCPACHSELDARRRAMGKITQAGG